MTLKPFDLESRGHFEYEGFAFRSGIAANRDHLSLFDSLHDNVAQQSKASLDRRADRDPRMTSTTRHE